MLLALDAGNTNVTIGVFEGERLAKYWRLRTVRDQSSDEWGIQIRTLFSLEGLDLAKVDGVIISSVVPSINARLREMCTRYFAAEPLFVSADLDLGLTIRYDNPREVGADRLADSVAAVAKYGAPCVVVDLGTAITFNCISANREYLGGLIYPGLEISLDALFARTARLPMVELRAPAKLIGSTSVGSIQSGLYYGTASLIDGVMERLIAELGPETACVATGGQAELIAGGSRTLRAVDRGLTLEGLRLIWDRNRAK